MSILTASVLSHLASKRPCSPSKVRVCVGAARSAGV
jgi:hypothetical protein